MVVVMRIGRRIVVVVIGLLEVVLIGVNRIWRW